MRQARLWGSITILLAIAIDQAHKFWMLGPFAIAERGQVAVAPWLDLVMVWNYGVSYGLLTQESDLGRWLLVAVGIGGAILFGSWMWTAGRVLPAVSLALIAGGALSNAIDRVLYGAVADFFLLHYGSFQWYVFNIADVWIVAGVVGMVLSWMTERRQNATEA